ncbi:hypothetical protein PUR71_11430 [Streptomyces sp. SP17BM10]|uniref:hypothetical protein n=1 Tax=Streptomyces sp. SP17BM10 TaxID=3002530 RepID=UPI002E79A825|nr:hypothetical protein [Streptomyces sp. SP17BM10]MEE1783514.1 hypothetical protein [Streptomyces sp. SP17BM10]
MTPTTPVGTTEPAAPPGAVRRDPRLERAVLRGTGAALALAAVGLPGGGGATDRFGPAAAVVATGLALWAAPPADDPPSRTASRPARLTASRTTLLASGSVVLAALCEPQVWQAIAVTVLLTAYVLLLDAFGPRRRTVRPAAACAAVAASLLVLPVAFAPTGAGEWSRPIALLGVAAAAWGVGLGLRRSAPEAAENTEASEDTEAAEDANREAAARG